LSVIKDAVLATRTTVEKIWDLVVLRFAPTTGTVERELENLGKVRITAEPWTNKTRYLLELEKPLLREGLLEKHLRSLTL